jgi:hypothetical protein
LSGARAGFAIALHMHQPLVPAGGEDLPTALIIGNLQHMMEHPEGKDNHNAPVFRECYRRISELVPQLVAEGKRPRVMLDYSGCLLYGLRQMGAGDVIDALVPLAREPKYAQCVEWLGTAWGHAVAPSTPPRDFRRHVRAWQHHFAGIFGLDALRRVRGFSPPEMALPNHPDDAYEFVRTLRECGYRWVLVQENSVEEPDGRGAAMVRRPHLPHRLVARNSRGQTASIIAIVKTRGSDNKLVAWVQPFHEALALRQGELAGRSVSQLVTQIGDGENGGVMMNDFPDAFRKAMREAPPETPAMNVSEYLSCLGAAGVHEQDLPEVRPVMQGRIWLRFEDGAGPEVMRKLIETLRAEDPQFHMEGGSWSGDRSWVRGYEDVLAPLREASELFEQKTAGVDTSKARYRNALFHLLAAQTSCYRYWGEGRWTDYGRELCRRTIEILRHDF